MNFTGIWESTVNVTKTIGGKAVSGVSSVKESFVWNFFNLIKDVAIFIIFLLLIGLLFYGMYRYFAYIKQNKNLQDEQADLLRVGRASAKHNKLRSLFTSVDGNKIVSKGFIVGYVEVEETVGEKTEEFSIFIVEESKFKPLNYYKVKKVDNEKLIGDVIIDNWNFIYDDTGMFLIPNTEEMIKIPKITDETIMGVDTISKMYPAINQSVKNNPYHIRQIRESKLINVGGGE